VRNIDRIAMTVLEAAVSARDWFAKGLQLQASLTYADSTIKQNAGFVATPGDTIGRWQPNIPRWQRDGAGEPPLRRQVDRHARRALQRPAVPHAE
jgi:hypothetical protein